jgi:hypothetical protein
MYGSLRSQSRELKRFQPQSRILILGPRSEHVQVGEARHHVGNIIGQSASVACEPSPTRQCYRIPAIEVGQTVDDGPSPRAALGVDLHASTEHFFGIGF